MKGHAARITDGYEEVDSGIYFLLIHLDRSVSIPVGALGEVEFPEGYYLYVGSAQRNMRKRIERHLRREKRKRWHIDYLLEVAEVVEHIAFPLPKRCEEEIAMNLGEKFHFVHGFGASDSRAKSHLFLGGREDLLSEAITLAERCMRDDNEGRGV